VTKLHFVFVTVSYMFSIFNIFLAIASGCALSYKCLRFVWSFMTCAERCIASLVTNIEIRWLCNSPNDTITEYEGLYCFVLHQCSTEISYNIQIIQPWNVLKSIKKTIIVKVKYILYSMF